VSGSAQVFLAIIAVATLVMALVQVALICAAGLLARRIGRLADEVEREIKPIFAHLNSIGRDASRAAALAAAQVERADQLFADLAARVEQAMAGVQHSLGAPAREGRAVPPGPRRRRRRPLHLRPAGRPHRFFSAPPRRGQRGPLTENPLEPRWAGRPLARSPAV